MSRKVRMASSRCSLYLNRRCAGAKRIGLLFSGAEIDYVVRDRVGDIGDLMVGDENFSDGCGLISKWLRCVSTCISDAHLDYRLHSIQLSRKKRIIYRGERYTPCVFQIRYVHCILWLPLLIRHDLVQLSWVQGSGDYERTSC